MTRAKRYANHAGGRKYDKASGEELAKSTTHEGAEEKLEASNIFREMWLRCREHEGYVEKKARFQAEQKAWDKEQRSVSQAAENGPERKTTVNLDSG
jgi:hypothetical protein